MDSVVPSSSTSPSSSHTYPYFGQRNVAPWLAITILSSSSLSLSLNSPTIARSIRSLRASAPPILDYSKKKHYSPSKRNNYYTTASSPLASGPNRFSSSSSGSPMISMSSSSSPTNNNNNNTAAAATSNSRLVYGRDDALFGAIEKQHGAVPFGSVLDAGTGLHSLRWLATLLTEKGMTDFVAVTADAIMQRNCQREIEALLGGGEPDASKKGTILCGNWFPSDTTTTTPTTITSTSTSESVDDDNGHNDTLAEIVEDSENDEVATKWNGGNNAGGNTAATFVNDIRLQLKDRQFDVILVDYLIGAMDGFSPHQQDLMLPTLARYLKPGGRMYIVGLEPIPDDEGLLGKVRRVRDACILLAGHKCYREYPVAWIHRQIDALSSPINDDNNERNENESPNRTNNHVDNNQDWNANNSNESSTPPPPQSVSLVRRHTKQFPILYRHATIVKQINVGRSKLAHMSSEALRLAMGQVLDDLEAESLLATSQSPTGRIQCGFDYVVTAERVR